MNCPHGVDAEKPCELCDQLMGRAWDIVIAIARCIHPPAHVLLLAESQPQTALWCPACGARKLAEGQWRESYGAELAKDLDAVLVSMGALPTRRRPS